MKQGITNVENQCYAKMYLQLGDIKTTECDKYKQEKKTKRKVSKKIL